jgi:hypothetical protein
MKEYPAKNFQWKWVWISFLIYVVLHSLPIGLLPGGVFGSSNMSKTSSLLMTVWGIGGMLLVSALIGYFTKGIMVKEQSVGAIVLMILWFIIIPPSIERPIRFSNEIKFIISIGIAVTVLAFIGAWWGGLVYRVGEKHKRHNLE